MTISTISFVDLAGSERLPSTLSDNPEQDKLRQKEVRAGAAWPFCIPPAARPCFCCCAAGCDEHRACTLPQTGNINKSLLTLGSCIRALAEVRRRQQSISQLQALAD